MKFVVLVSLCLLIVSAFGDDCSSKNSCSACSQEPGCGWCAPVQQCMNGTVNGPTTGVCLGDSWEYQACTPCTTYTDCQTCLLHDSDCFFCNSTQSCKPNGFAGCPRVKNCPCEQFETCFDCTQQSNCAYCAGSQSCVPIETGCTAETGPANVGSCDCPAFPDCRTCLDGDCAWCDSSMSCLRKNATAGCAVAHSCTAFCASLPSCQTCTNAIGCAWCASTQTCTSIEGRIPSCANIQRTCPKCGDRHYCDTCLDEPGCTWCENTATCSDASTAGPECFQTHSCVSYCVAIGSCQTCNEVKGCGWCEDTQTCTSVDAGSCAFVHSCTNPSPVNPAKPGFDGAAFVGGMFLVIGIVAIALGGFAFYRWRTGQRLLYTELK